MKAVLFRNGTFWPVGAAGAEAGALLARGGEIQAVGAAAEREAAGAEGIDLGGRTAIPAPVDAHCHLVSYGMIRLREADLRGTRSLEELGRRLRAHAALLDLRPG